MSPREWPSSPNEPIWQKGRPINPVNPANRFKMGPSTPKGKGRGSFLPPAPVLKPRRPGLIQHPLSPPLTKAEIESRRFCPPNGAGTPRRPMEIPTTSRSALDDTQSPRLGSPGFQRINITVSVEDGGFCDMSVWDNGMQQLTLTASISPHTISVAKVFDKSQSSIGTSRPIVDL